MIIVCHAQLAIPRELIFIYMHGVTEYNQGLVYFATKRVKFRDSEIYTFGLAKMVTVVYDFALSFLKKRGNGIEG
jgi:hypothetical protein